MRVSIIGSGYVGLVSGVCLAAAGHRVVSVDRNPEIIARINRGITPIFEPGLAALLTEHLGRGFSATTDLGAAVRDTDITLIAVGTPFSGTGIDLRQVEAVAREIGIALRDTASWHVVAVKSTVVPGTTDDVVGPLIEKHSGKRAGVGFGIGANPEFLREGQAVADFQAPDRIVIGGSDERTLDALASLYDACPDAAIVLTNNRTAETIKYTTNALLATMISFSNEIGNVCAALPDVDVLDVMRGVHLDGRLSPMRGARERVTPGILTYLQAGCGFGGSCFPKDVRALIAHADSLGVPMRMLQATMAVNADQPARLIAMLRAHMPDLAGARVTVLGLAFKPDTDDIRESPAIAVIEMLLAQGAVVTACDPAAGGPAAALFGIHLTICDDLAEAVAGAEAVIVVTPWDEFRRLPELLDRCDPAPVVIDGRRAFDRDRFVRYAGIGFAAAPYALPPIAANVPARPQEINVQIS